jgi:hypothetical protein
VADGKVARAGHRRDKVVAVVVIQDSDAIGRGSAGMFGDYGDGIDAEREELAN